MVSPSTSDKDRRRFHRYPIPAQIRYAPREFGDNVPSDLWEGALVNISRSGAALKVMHRLGPGGVVEISIIKDNPPRCVSVTGKVVRCEPLPGLHLLSPEGTARRCYLVAVEFNRVLEIEELASLRESLKMDATLVEGEKRK